MYKARKHAFTHTGSVHQARLSLATECAQTGRKPPRYKVPEPKGENTRPQAAKPPTPKPFPLKRQAPATLWTTKQKPKPFKFRKFQGPCSLVPKGFFMEKVNLRDGKFRKKVLKRLLRKCPKTGKRGLLTSGVGSAGGRMRGASESKRGLFLW